MKLKEKIQIAYEGAKCYTKTHTVTYMFTPLI